MALLQPGARLDQLLVLESEGAACRDTEQWRMPTTLLGQADPATLPGQRAFMTSYT